jgi:phage shock protein A
MRLFARIQNLLRGAMSQWLGHREQRNPGAVYEAAIQERLNQYATLREAAAGVLYLRTKLARELQLKSSELTRLGGQLDIAVDHDDDAVALVLIARRDTVAAEVERLTGELAELTTEAEAAKKNLIAFHNDIARLREEKVRMVARLANAKARMRLQETLSGLSPDADIRALDEVRDHINRLVAEIQLSRDTADPELERRLGSIREAEANAAARAQLDELKRARKRTLLPLVLPRTAAASQGQMR